MLTNRVGMNQTMLLENRKEPNDYYLLLRRRYDYSLLHDSLYLQSIFNNQGFIWMPFGMYFLCKVPLHSLIHRYPICCGTRNIDD